MLGRLRSRLAAGCCSLSMPLCRLSQYITASSWVYVCPSGKSDSAYLGTRGNKYSEGSS
ncbi:hypothetical protein PF005_g31930 [Phytophthora fragariae]|uniref:Uncharacterized protein n=1 Tax=Phytophthora fragariae TaxID=53985 RepID=A0A6A3PC71_9STRA|nr:hypothetical protein PF003_g4652 [Phytophthora fragariae]KAE8920950.1 hypothetical protein PF009_g28763 [Phytophthora fragariae]KAE8961677.1 hypothetical protein PF011_g29662 [Phytophthora fragariae]KAE9057218.1 hypothetical protein PF007_g31721 [Phytophthora fragariae]KAE9057312.1 hypothetical protein PF010_g31425 [Phytophthora fragariae]